jgi:hypothetical protein
VYGIDLYASGARPGLDACCFGLETYEPVIDIEGTVCWREDQEMVVGGEQLEGPGDFEQAAHRINLDRTTTARGSISIGS